MLEAQQAATELAVRQHEAGNIGDLELSNEQAVYTHAKLDLARVGYQLLADRESLMRILRVWGRRRVQGDRRARSRRARAGAIPPSGQWPVDTANIPPGTARDITS